MRGITRLALPALLLAGLTVGSAGPALAAAPSNDDFQSAITVGTLPYTSGPIDTTEATTAADDPFCQNGEKSVWFQFTATDSGFVAFDTFQSDFDTVLAAYTGTQGDLTEIACNDQFNSDQSKITFETTAGTTYYIMAAGWFGATGTLVLHGDVSEAPFTFDVSFASKGTVVPRTGEATISGTVVCSEPGSVYVEAELRQRAGRTIISGYGFTEVECSTEPTSFTISVVGSNGRFVGGKATIRNVYIEGCPDSGDCTSDFIEGPLAVKLTHR